MNALFSSSFPNSSQEAAAEVAADNLAANKLQPRRKKQLMEWIKECDGGVKNHGEPNTWDVTLVTDMSSCRICSMG